MKASLTKPRLTHYVSLRDSGLKGKGLFALRTIPKGTKFCIGGTYVIELKNVSHSLWDFCMNTPAHDGTVLLPYHVADIGWWIANHACFPNCDTSCEDGGYLQAKQEIRQGEEITIFYSGWREKEANIPCLCGHPGCLGWIRTPVEAGPNEIARWRDHMIGVLGMTHQQCVALGF